MLNLVNLLCGEHVLKHLHNNSLVDLKSEVTNMNVIWKVRAIVSKCTRATFSQIATCFQDKSKNQNELE